MEERRLLHVVASSRGGGAVHMQALTAALIERGYVAAAAMPLDGGNVEGRDFEDAGVRFFPLSNSPSTLPQVRALVSACRRFSPAAVHAHGSRAALWARCALLLARCRGTRLVYSVHGFATPHYRQPRRLLQTLAMRWVARGASAVLACCRAEREALLHARCAAEERSRVVPYGIDLTPLLALGGDDRRQAREALDIDRDDWLLLMVCRLDVPRDFDTLLAAFLRVVEVAPDARLFIVGDGPDRSRIEALIEELGLGLRVRTWGFRRDVLRFLAAADALVLTSWGWEGLPISVIEAQAAGLPVVVTDAGGSGEAIADGVTGSLVPRRDVDALSRALSDLANRREAAAAMGARGRERARANFGLDTMAARVHEVYASRELV